MQIRQAVDSDLDAILELHNEAILHSTALWTDTAVDRADRERWLDELQRNSQPVLVALVDGRFAGYASYGFWRPKFGYRFSAQNSIYLVEQFRAKGIGRSLMIELIAHAKASGYHSMVADIEAENQASIALHSSLGFVLEGTLTEIGFKFNRWLDLAIMRLPLQRTDG